VAEKKERDPERECLKMATEKGRSGSLCESVFDFGRFWKKGTNQRQGRKPQGGVWLGSKAHTVDGVHKEEAQVLREKKRNQREDANAG